MQPITTPAPSAPVPVSAADRDRLLLEWQGAKTALDKAKERERELRDKLVYEACGFDPNKVTGTERLDLGNGWEVKAVKSQKFKLENKEGETFAALEKMSLLGEASDRAAKHLCTFNPSLKKTEYEKLSPEERAIIDEVLTVVDGAPTLQLIAPKE